MPRRNRRWRGRDDPQRLNSSSILLPWKWWRRSKEEKFLRRFPVVTARFHYIIARAGLHALAEETLWLARLNSEKEVTHRRTREAAAHITAPLNGAQNFDHPLFKISNSISRLMLCLSFSLCCTQLRHATSRYGTKKWRSAMRSTSPVGPRASRRARVSSSTAAIDPGKFPAMLSRYIQELLIYAHRDRQRL